MKRDDVKRGGFLAGGLGLTVVLVACALCSGIAHSLHQQPVSTPVGQCQLPCVFQSGALGHYDGPCNGQPSLWCPPDAVQN